MGSTPFIRTKSIVIGMSQDVPFFVLWRAFFLWKKESSPKSCAKS